MHVTQRGFSLVEVLVALIVCSVGLLGLAKMESLALSSTNVAGTRAIAAQQAASMAAMMKSNDAYWQSGLATTYTINAATATTAAPVNCLTATAGTCAPADMAAYDIQQWAIALAQIPQLQGFFATITCSTAGFPVTCTISLQWAESAVAMNQSQTGMAALQLAAPYVLYVQP